MTACGLTSLCGRGLVALVWFGATVASAETARYLVDQEHSIIEFQVKHMVISKTTGRFMDYSGFVDLDADAKEVKAIEATIKAASLNTNHQKRDAHLRTADFFDVERYPTVIYRLKRVKKTGDEFTAWGELTLHGVTKEITLVGSFNGSTKDPWGNVRAGFTGRGQLNRKDFGMNWSKTLDNGGLIVGDEVDIRLEVEAIKAKPEK
ncbi:polyisoprenoid-binding protein [Nitrospira sp.]|nr:polyisoprenoid-binding protein [Nitrospira sp.]